jgi:hypothetical protein
MPNPPERFRSFSRYLKNRFGGPVRKISLDPGFSCPNRDGTLSQEGCVFCNPLGFTQRLPVPAADLKQQLALQIAQAKSRGITRVMAYFQPYSNTHAPLPQLQAAYEAIRDFPEVKALAIGTRPDCMDEERVSLIAGYARDYEVWLEYGLQSIHDATLQRLNRGHDAAAFFRAVSLTRQFPEIRICVHVILGLPGEDPRHELETAGALARCRVEGVKLHPLHIVAGTALASSPEPTPLLSRAEYIERAGRFLEQLWPETLVQRLTADCRPDLLVAPAWLAEKTMVLQGIQAWLEQADTWQGKKYLPEPAMKSP